MPLASNFAAWFWGREGVRVLHITWEAGGKHSKGQCLGKLQIPKVPSGLWLDLLKTLGFLS